MTDAINSTELNETDYLKLFMQELTYQDPLQPLDNREFMAQMAQFSSLQEERTTNANLVQLLAMTSGNQCLGLLGKTVTLNSGERGQVSKVKFFAQAPPKIQVSTQNGGVNEVELNAIAEVEQ